MREMKQFPMNIRDLSHDLISVDLSKSVKIWQCYRAEQTTVFLRTIDYTMLQKNNHKK